MTTDNKVLDVARLYAHLKNLLLKQYGVEITPEWEQRVLDGTHDVPLPLEKSGSGFRRVSPTYTLETYSGPAILGRRSKPEPEVKPSDAEMQLELDVDSGEMRALTMQPLTHKNCGGAIAQVPADEEKPYEYEQEDGMFAYIPVMRCLKCRHEIGGNADITEFTPQREVSQVTVAKLDTPKDPELRPTSKGNLDKLMRDEDQRKLRSTTKAVREAGRAPEYFTAGAESIEYEVLNKPWDEQVACPCPSRDGCSFCSGTGSIPHFAALAYTAYKRSQQTAEEARWSPLSFQNDRDVF